MPGSSVLIALILTWMLFNNENPQEVSESDDELRINTEKDNQLNFAIKLLNG